MASILEIRLLGRFEILLDGRALEIHSRAARSLVAYIALRPDTHHRREKLAGLLWPDIDETKARANLRHALWILRREIGDDFLTADESGISLSIAPGCQVDAITLERQGSASTPIEDRLKALSLYVGELLPGVYEEWVSVERERIAAVFHRWIQPAVDELVEEGRWQEAIDWAERWISLGQVPELAYRTLMIAHAALGDRGGMADAYNRCVHALKADLGVDPSAETAELYQRLMAGARPGAAGPWVIDSLASAPHRIASIAVLPLANLTGDPGQEYFVLGITDQLIAALGQVSALRVISRTSVVQYGHTTKAVPTIARELGVDAVIEGSVMRTSDGVRLTAQLIAARPERHVWAATYERPMEDVLGLQSDVVHAVAAEAHAALSAQEADRLAGARRVNPEAYQLCLKGNFHLAKISLLKALQHFKLAIEKDPGYAPAYVGMALAQLDLGGWWGHLAARAVEAEAKAAAMTALKLDARIPEAHLALAAIRELFEWDWEGAERSFAEGMALNPSSSIVLVYACNYLTAMGRFRESIELGRKMVEIDPLSPAAYNELGWAMELAGRKYEALEQYRKAMDLDPNFPQTHLILADFHIRNGALREALAHHERSRASWPDRSPSGSLGWDGYHAGKLGRRDEALTILKDLEGRATTEYVPATARAQVHLGLGEREAAVECLEEAFVQHDPGMVWLNVHWAFDEIRPHPHFRDILLRMKFPPRTEM